MTSEDREEIIQTIKEQSEILRALNLQELRTEIEKLRKDLEPWIRATQVLDSVGVFSRWFSPIFRFFFVLCLAGAFFYVAFKRVMN